MLMRLKSNQNGSALVISLMILLVLSLLGMSAVQVSTVEERMAGNLRNSNLAFQAAETALRDGEADLAAAVPANFNCTHGLFRAGDADCDNSIDATLVWDGLDWSDDDVVIRYDRGGLTEVVHTQPAYIVEQLAGVAAANDSLQVPAALDTSYYRITARGTGGTDTAVAIVQSIFKR